jgi:hypothetical protein
MSAIKHLLKIDNFDKKIEDVFRKVVGEENGDIIKEFLDFYQLKAELTGDILHIYMYFSHKKSFLKIAEHNLETEETKTVYPREKLLNMIIKENETLLKEAEKHINRSAYIILSILALATGGITGYILFKLLENSL